MVESNRIIINAHMGETTIQIFLEQFMGITELICKTIKMKVKTDYLSAPRED